jgi:hypothetical protein
MYGREGADIRLVLALGTSEPCYGAEDDDEDDAHEEAPAVVEVSTDLRSLTVRCDIPVCHYEELLEKVEFGVRRDP